MPLDLSTALTTPATPVRLTMCARDLAILCALADLGSKSLQAPATKTYRTIQSIRKSPYALDLAAEADVIIANESDRLSNFFPQS